MLGSESQLSRRFSRAPSCAFRRPIPISNCGCATCRLLRKLPLSLDGTLDIGILRLPIAHAELQSISLFRERLVLHSSPSVAYKAERRRDCCPARSPASSLPRLTSATFHDHVLGLCRRARFTPHIVQEASEMFTILNFVRSGLGVSLVPSAAIRMNVPGVRFHELRIPEAEWLIGTASHRLSEKRELISRFTSAIRAVVRGRGSHR